MILPPITVYSANLENARDALTHHLKEDIISTMSMDEQCVHFTFRNVEPSPLLRKMVNDLALGIEFVYQGTTYKLHTQYFDI
jgi:hypothetical protein